MKNTTTKGGAVTAKAFRTRTENLLRNTHPDASIGFAWAHCEKVKWFDGSIGYSGVVTVQAPGFRTRSMVASMSHGELSVK